MGNRANPGFRIQDPEESQGKPATEFRFPLFLVPARFVSFWKSDRARPRIDSVDPSKALFIQRAFRGRRAVSEDDSVGFARDRFVLVVEQFYFDPMLFHFLICGISPRTLVRLERPRAVFSRLS